MTFKYYIKIACFQGKVLSQEKTLHAAAFILYSGQKTINWRRRLWQYTCAVNDPSRYI